MLKSLLVDRKFTKLPIIEFVMLALTTELSFWIIEFLILESLITVFSPTET